jgi:hypothetical protein
MYDIESQRRRKLDDHSLSQHNTSSLNAAKASMEMSRRKPPIEILGRVRAGQESQRSLRSR